MVEFGEKLQGCRIVSLQAGCELIDQAGLSMDKNILVAGEDLQLQNDGTVGFQLAQIGKVTAAGTGQQARIDAVGLGPGRFPPPVHRLGIHRVDGEAHLQERGNEQAVVGLHEAGDALGISGDAQ